MAILKIARMGHPILRMKAQAVPDPTAPGIKRLVDDMVATMHEADGTGLAAPQVHVPLRVVVYFVAPERENDGEAVPLTALINPEIETLSTEKTSDWEACLSLPGLAGQVPRFDKIKLSYSDLKGESHSKVLSGFHARVVQHECDHLDGLLYPQRMSDMTSLVYAEELAAAERRAQQQAAARSEEKAETRH